MEPGTLLNHFRVDSLLAEGGMGAVYKGFDLSLQRPVALKVIRSEWARQPEFLTRFMREARAQARVGHSNVVQVYFVGQEGNTLFMAMELVDGGSLAEQVHRNGPLDWKMAFTHLRGLTEGLSEAARLNIIHRDIKPPNILLDRFGLAHLADFGLAASALSNDNAEFLSDTQPSLSREPLPHLTQVGMIMGSPAYMSPEQAQGQPLDVRSDIYSLGATFYEVLTGQPPVTAGSLNELLAFHATGAPVRLSSRRPDLPRAFTAIIDRCLERDRARRFQNYAELMAALEAAHPRPIITAGAVARLLAYGLDVTPYVLTTWAFFQQFALAGFVALSVWYGLGHRWLHSSPGQWMVRLAVRQPNESVLTWRQVALRFFFQHGWLGALSLLLAAIYQSRGVASEYASAVVMGILFIVGVLGSAAAFFDSQGRTWVDRLSRARVLVDVK